MEDTTDSSSISMPGKGVTSEPKKQLALIPTFPFTEQRPHSVIKNALFSFLNAMIVFLIRVADPGSHLPKGIYYTKYYGSGDGRGVCAL